MTEQSQPTTDQPTTDQPSTDQPSTEQPSAQQATPPPYQPPPPPYAATYKRLTRTSWDAPVSGVCGGIARYLGVDPTVIRVLAAVMMVVTFPAGPIAYAVMWAVMPRE